jgi:outer membrane receptor protein involved in Fe transport
VELGAGFAFTANLRLDAALSYAEHTYEDFVTSTANLSGKEIESAPNFLGNLRLTWNPVARSRVLLEWVRIGEYWMDAANTTKYEGHDLFNLRADYAVTPGVSLYGSVQNLTDERYADSASISSSTPVFSPGLPRTLYGGVEVRW